jgi:two-component system response regulator FixJ
MSPIRSVHLIDPDTSRRASIARDLYSRGIHTEVYEGLREFAERVPATGTVLANDGSDDDANQLLKLIECEVGYLPVAMFASSPSPEMIVRAMTCGATSYLKWPFVPGEVERVIDDMAQRAARDVRTERKFAKAREAASTLSRREIDVLRVLLDGASNKEIARKLAISHRTVEIHRANIMSKLNARSVADVVRIGIYANLDDPETLPAPAKTFAIRH